MGAQLAIQRYRLWLEDYRGVDCRGCANSSRPIGAREVETGLGWRASVFLRFGGAGASSGRERASLFWERDGRETWLVGLSYARAFRLLG